VKVDRYFIKGARLRRRNVLSARPALVVLSHHTTLAPYYVDSLKLRLFTTLGALSLAATAATSTVWEVNGFADFLKGRPVNLALSADGVLQPGPAVRWSTALDQPALWSIAPAPDGSMFASTGHSGKVYRVAANGVASLAWSAPQSEVFALASDANGILYAGSSPSGSVFRIEGSSAKEIWRPPAKYIWALKLGREGELYIATGEPGRVYRLAPGAGSAELYYETGQANVTALAIAANGHVLAGTDPNGLLDEISAAGKANMLYDSSLPEIRAIVSDAKGNLYVAAMGGALSTRTGGAYPGATSTATVVNSTPTVITVSEAKESGVTPDNDQSGVKVSSDTNKVSAAAQASAAVASNSVTEVSGVEKSAIYRISPGGAVETVRTSKDDNVYDLMLAGDDLLFSTDENGRIYRWHDHQTTLIAEPGNGETTRLAEVRGSLYAAMSNPARLFAFGAPGSAPSSYESQVHDSISVAHWGHLQWHGMGVGVSFRTRTGNTARPDATWSAWSEPITDAANSLLKSPPARFVQWRAEWPVASSAAISTVDIPYLPQNGPPALHSITVTSIVATNPQKSGSPAANSSSAYSITVTDTGEAPAASSASSATQSVSHLQSTQTQVSWQADDPDGDKLVYSLYFRAEDETNWHLIRSRMFENSLLLDPDVFADGRYYFKVVASDSPANAGEYAQQAQIVSAPVLIDNTPPLVTLQNVKRDGNLLDVDIEADDKTSPLRLCEYSIDAGFWQPVEAVEGVTDSPREHFHLHLDSLHPGEHLLVVRVYDSANNAGLARVTLK
jgi:hypothetical protein